MPQKSGFFDTTLEDPREYPAREFAEYFAQFIGNGIFGGGTNLKVETAGTDMKVTVNIGHAWINGYMYSVYGAPLTFTLDTSLGVDRIDRIVLRLDTNIQKRSITAVVIKGDSDTVPPAIIRSGEIYDISLAQVLVLQNTTVIEPHQITDERLDNTVCGIVTGLIEQANTTAIFNQFQAWYVSRTAQYQLEWHNWFEAATTIFGAEWTAWFNATKQQWQEWFDSISKDAPVVSVNGKGGVVVIDATDVGAAKASDLTSHLADYASHVPYGGTTTNSGNNYSIANPPIDALAEGKAVSFKCNADSTGAATLNWNGIGAKNIKKANGGNVTNLKNGGVYTVRYDGTAFTLQGEGASGNATASDLRSGKTASTDAGEITGTLDLSKLIPTNIKKDVVIDGVTGTLSPGPTASPGVNPIGVANTERTSTVTTYTKQKEIVATISGIFRISFDFRITVNTTPGGYARIYKNGVPYGIERNKEGTGSTTYQTFTQDLAFEAGDLIQLYTRRDSSTPAIQNFQVQTVYICPTNLD